MAGRKYDKAPDELLDRVKQVMARFHNDLFEKEIRIETLVVYGPRTKDGLQTGPALVVRGREAAACIRISSLEERVAGRGDAIMKIDGDRYKKWSVETLQALIDHELTHLRLHNDPRTGNPVVDDVGRWRLEMREHDFEVGWFHEIADRHGYAAFEVQQASTLLAYRQQYFPGFEIREKVSRKKGA